MSDERFLDRPVDQAHVLPTSVDTYVSGSNHLALSVRYLVRSKLNLSKIEGCYAEGRGS